jgi:hypothetical protein
MKSVSGDEPVWNTHSVDTWIFKDDYSSNFVVPLWLRLRNIYAEKKNSLAQSLSKKVGYENPSSGLSRAIVTLMSHEIHELNEASSSSKKEPQTTSPRPRGSVASSLA